MAGSESSKYKFAVSLLVFAISLFFQLNWKTAFGWTPEFVIAALVVFSFYLGVLEMAALSAFGVLVLNWRPFPGYEILFFFLIPFSIVFLRKIFPLRSRFNNIAGMILAVSIFYLVSAPAAIVANLSLFSLIVLTTVFFGAAVFQVMNYFYKVSPV